MSLQKYLPYEKYTLISRLTAEQICQRIAQNTEQKKIGFLRRGWRGSEYPYEGYITGHLFRISRIIRYRNSFQPVIKGHILPFHGHTQVNIDMRLPDFTMFFMCVWLGVVGLVCLGMIIGIFVHLGEEVHSKLRPDYFIPFIMFLFGYFLALIGFKTESAKSKLFLSRLLEEIDAKY